MTPVQKALWFAERHFASEITLDDIAAAADASRYYITRAFTAISGQPLMRYVRGRRLTTAARALANGAPDILAVA
jgi:AraC family transcriptional regulator